MSGEWITLIWLIAGLLLVLSELLHTSLTTLFLGAAAVVVAILRAVGLVDGTVLSFVLWAVTTLGMSVSLRPIARRYLPGESKYDPSNEDRDAYGMIVTVVETVNENDDAGRIRFQGTTWPATSLDGTLPAGSSARLVCREKLAWIVEPPEKDERLELEAKIAKR